MRAKYLYFKKLHTSPTIFSLSFGELSAINNVIAVNAAGVILFISKIFAWRKYHTNA